MSRKKERSLQLFKWSVITALAACAFLYLMVLIVLWQRAVSPPPEAPRQEMSRPQKCAKYHIEYTEDQWDPITETYPDNPEWMRCMGVERRG